METLKWKKVTVKENIGKQVGKTKHTLPKTIRKVCNLWRKNRQGEEKSVF